jgi:hypothetical protein
MHSKPDLYDRDPLWITRSKFLLVEGPLQNQNNVIYVQATRLIPHSDRALRCGRTSFIKKRRVLADAARRYQHCIICLVMA